MRKILSVIFVLTLLSEISSAKGRKVGMLSNLNMSQKEYRELMANARGAGSWNFFSSKSASEPTLCRL